MFAGMARRRRAREMERRLRELDRWDELYGLGALPSGPPPRHRRRGGAGWVVLLALVGLGLLFPSQTMGLLERGRELLPGESQDAIAWGSDVGSQSQELPQLPVGEAQDQGWGPTGGERLRPAVPVTTDGAYAFLWTQPGSGEPVGFSPCAPVEVVVNASGAPREPVRIVEESLARLSEATGLELILVGESEDDFADERQPGDPVVIGWADEDEVPELAGLTAGYGGPLVMTDRFSGERWLASGSVVLDRDGLLGEETVGTVLDHELGHVLGLDHVEDERELMAATNTGQRSFGPGDLAGLAQLGAIDCR